MSFHETRFPTAVSLGSQMGPERKTDVVVLGSGFEERNSSWADSRRSYNAGYGIKSLDELYDVVTFYEERRGRLYGFRWKDALDHKSSRPGNTISSVDQVIGVGDGVLLDFQLQKTYGANYSPWIRSIKKPVSGSVLIAVDGIEKSMGTDFIVDYTSGLVSFVAGQEPSIGAQVTAGFEFDVPVRFETDKLNINLQNFNGGAIPDIPVVEIRL